MNRQILWSFHPSASRLMVSLAVAVFLAASFFASAQQVIETPFEPSADSEFRRAGGAVAVTFSQEAFDRLAQRRGGLMAGVPLPGGGTADFDVITHATGFAGGIEITAVSDEGIRRLPVPRVEVLVGEAADGSGAEICVSRVGGQLFGTLSMADGTKASIVPVSKEQTGLYQITTLAPDGMEPFRCANDDYPGLLRDVPDESDPKDLAEAKRRSANPLSKQLARIPDFEVTVALETTHAYYQHFGAAEPASYYALALLSAVNVVYHRDFGVVLRPVSLRLWETADDPYPSGNDSREYLDALSAVMDDSATSPVIRDAGLAHVLDRNTSTGGIAYVGVLCASDDRIRTGYSGIHASYSFPSGSYIWDIDVMAHEMGHNFGSSHTHCYSPPIDRCYTQQAGCYSGSAVPEAGTIMSYCHLVYRKELRFHPRVISLVRDYVLGRTCLSDSPHDAYEPDDTPEDAPIITFHHDQFRTHAEGETWDHARFRLTKQSGVTVETIGEEGDTVLEILDGSGTVIASDDNSGEGNFSRIDLNCPDDALPGGEFTIRIGRGPNAPDTFGYRLRFSDYACDGSGTDTYEPNGDPDSATPLTPGVELTANLRPERDADWYRFTVDSIRGALVVVDSNASSRRHHGTLINEGMEIVQETRDTYRSEMLLECTDGLFLEPGEYYILVTGTSSYQPLDSYSIRVDLLDECCAVNPTATTEWVDLPGGTIDVPVDTSSGCTWTAQSGVDWIGFPEGDTGTGDGMLLIEVNSFVGTQREGLVSVLGDIGTTQTVRVVQFSDCNTNGLRDDWETGDLTVSPPGETCGEAAPIMPGIQYSGSTASAENDGSADCGATGESKDVWYAYVPSEDGTMTASLCGSSYDTVLSVHTACPGSSANQLACNDDSCSRQSEVTLAVEAGVLYYLRIGGWQTEEGDFVLYLTGPASLLGTAPDENGNGLPDECDQPQEDRPSGWLLLGE